MTAKGGIREIGPYTIFGEIASGGMATVHIGRKVGAGGFARTVAIKELHPQLAADPVIMAMFLDEAWLCARIHHPNVVQILDVVSEGGELLLVMDYVQGETLARVWRTLRERGERVPIPITASVLTGVLHGLHAAHEAKDDAGKPLEIVHRDVSPQNVIVGVDGIARLLDFGVAKASVRLQSTQDGQVKGKLAYMAPELLDRHEVSRLSDIYAVGVLLWEGLTGERLFEARTEGEVIHRVLSGAIRPPSADVDGIPPELDAITLRALLRDPAKRFPTAREMALAIERSTEIARASQVGEWLERIAKPLLEERAQRIAALHAQESVPPVPPPVSQGSSSVRVVEREPLSSTPVRTAERTKRAKRRVLAIDDSELILGKIRRALEAEGIEVVTTTRTVGNARHLVDCDIVIIDYHMPGLDGGAVISSLRSAASKSSHPVLFYLYTQDPTVAREYAKLGFDGCLTSKGDDKELVRQVNAAFRMLQLRALKK